MGNGSSNRAGYKNRTKPIEKPPPVYSNVYPGNYMPDPNYYHGYTYNYPGDWYGNNGQTGYYPQPPTDRKAPKVSKQTHHHRDQVKESHHHSTHRHDHRHHHPRRRRHHHRHHHVHQRDKQTSTEQVCIAREAQTTPSLFIGNDPVEEGPRSTPVFLRESSSSESSDEDTMSSMEELSPTISPKKPSSSVIVEKRMPSSPAKQPLASAVIKQPLSSAVVKQPLPSAVIKPSPLPPPVVARSAISKTSANIRIPSVIESVRTAKSPEKAANK